MTTATAETQDTEEVRGLIRDLLNQESAIQDQINRWSRGVREVWDLHLASDCPSMESWGRAWSSEREGHAGVKLPSSIRKAIVRELVKDGMSNRAVAVALGIAVDTANRDAKGTERNRSVGANGKGMNTGNIGKGRKPKAEAAAPNSEIRWNPGDWNDEAMTANPRLVKVRDLMADNLDGIADLGTEGEMLARLGQTLTDLVGAEKKTMALAQAMHALAEFASSYRTSQKR